MIIFEMLPRVNFDIFVSKNVEELFIDAVSYIDVFYVVFFLLQMQHLFSLIKFD